MFTFTIFKNHSSSTTLKRKTDSRNSRHFTCKILTSSILFTLKQNLKLQLLKTFCMQSTIIISIRFNRSIQFLNPAPCVKYGIVATLPVMLYENRWPQLLGILGQSFPIIFKYLKTLEKFIWLKVRQFWRRKKKLIPYYLIKPWWFKF